jgi:hypothetical protein
VRTIPGTIAKSEERVVIEWIVVAIPVAKAYANRKAGIVGIVVERVVIAMATVKRIVVVAGEIARIPIRLVARIPVVVVAVVIILAFVVIARDDDFTVFTNVRLRLHVLWLTVVIVLLRGSKLGVAAGEAEEHESGEEPARGECRKAFHRIHGGTSGKLKNVATIR